jgi:hypothetical protein
MSGGCDWGMHGNSLGLMIEERTDFNNSVQAQIDYLDVNTNGNNWDNTLLIEGNAACPRQHKIQSCVTRGCELIGLTAFFAQSIRLNRLPGIEDIPRRD